MLLVKVDRKYIIIVSLLFTNPLSMMTLSQEHFHSTTHVNHILMSQLQDAREFMRSAREALRRSHPWSSSYFTNTIGSWYPPTESCTGYREISLALLKNSAAVYVDVSNEENLKTWIVNCIDYYELLLLLPKKADRILVINDLH